MLKFRFNMCYCQVVCQMVKMHISYIILIFLSEGSVSWCVFCECDCNRKWVVWISMRLFIWCGCDYCSRICVCVLSHMNRFHTHSVRLRCAIHTKDMNHSHTMWTVSQNCIKKLQSHSHKIVPCEWAFNSNHIKDRSFTPLWIATLC